MQLTNDEVQQLKTVGFSEQQVEAIGAAKAGATQSGMNWIELFAKLIQNGPQLLQLLQLLKNLFGNTSPAVGGDGAIPPK